MSDKIELVAVYGSLRKGLGNHRIIKDKEQVGIYHTPPEYHMVSLGGFPGVIEGGNTSIVTEVYRVPDEETMLALDMLEGYRGNREDNFYDKIVIETEYGPAYMYTLDNRYLNDRSPVQNGDWVEYIQR